MAKDLFSGQSDFYAKYRPTYPPELFEYILSFVDEKDTAWDCATGNGQAAQVLANYFKRVEATDISEAQLNLAVQAPNIHYQISAAEKTPFADNTFDLITVATAYHWLNWKAFYDEATRVGKPNAVVSVWGYNLFSCADEKITQLIHHFYYDLIHPYWDPGRRFVEQSYTAVEFDFAPLPGKDFQMKYLWDKEHFTGYLQSWSAVQSYLKQNNVSPLTLIEPNIDKLWSNKDEVKTFYFPLFMKIGRITK